MKFITAILLVSAAIQAPCRAASPDLSTSELATKQAAAGAQLNYFDQVDQGVFKGSKPASDADFRFLQSLGVKYIVVLRVLPFTHHAEVKQAKKYGMTVIQEEMNASPFSPTEKHITKILTVIRDQRNHPVYFHCSYGRDRTSVIAILYEMYFEGLPEAKAMSSLYEAGYKKSWVRGGLSRYVKKHPMPPSALLGAPAAP